jgi:hypothetical protein
MSKLHPGRNWPKLDLLCHNLPIISRNDVQNTNRTITSVSNMARLKPLLIILLLALGCVPVRSPSPANATPVSQSLQDLWIDVSMGPPLVSWFNSVARPDDIARADHVSQLRLLEDVEDARRLVVFKSAVAAEDAVPQMADRLDIIGYNLESGPANPVEEQSDPVTFVQRMHDLAREHDLLLAMGPDRTFSEEYGAEIAPYVDLFVLQVQRVQTDPRTVRDFVVPMVMELREANPDIEVSIQVRTEGDVVALVDLIDSLTEYLDGVSILTSPETVNVAAALVDELRSRGPDPLPTAIPESTLTKLEAPGITPEAALAKAETPTAILEPTLAAIQMPTSEGALPPSTPPGPTDRLEGRTRPTQTATPTPVALTSAPASAAGSSRFRSNEASVVERLRISLWPLLAAGGLIMAFAAVGTVAALFVLASRRN